MIREATLDDVSDIQKIAKVTWHATYEGIISKEAQDDFLKKAYSIEMLHHRLDSSHFYVAEENDQVVGFANFSPLDPYTNISTLTAIYILPSFQNRKIGSQLLDRGLKELKSAKKILVDVEKDNQIGKAFYYSKGFSIEKEYVDEFFGHHLNTVQMSLTL